MTAATLTPADFLTARYDEAEVDAGEFWHGLEFEFAGSSNDFDQRLARALADIRADRAILALHAPDDDDTTFASCGICAKESETWDGESEGWETVFVSWPCDTVRLLVCKFATHPDCRPEWLPF